MGILEQGARALSISALSAALAGCGDGNNIEVTTSSASLTVPYSAADLGAGRVHYSVTLPSGQHYVEVFARKNGVQNTAHDITSSGIANADDSETYSFDKSGYALGDFVEYRFYSYVGPRVFTPGPAQTNWASFTYGASVTFQTSIGNYLIGAQQDGSGRRVSYQVETSTGKTSITPFSTGWFLSKASPADDSVEAKFSEADLIGSFVKKSGSDVYDPITAYDDYAITATHSAGFLDIAVSADTAIYPGTVVDTRYAEGGHSVTIPTFIGPQTLLTDATVSFAYLIKQKTWFGE